MNEILIGFCLIGLTVLVVFLILGIKYIKWLRLNGKLISKKEMQKREFLDAILEQKHKRECYYDFLDYIWDIYE